MPARLDIAVQRNEAFAATMVVSDDSGTAIDLTGMSATMSIREKVSDLLIQSALLEMTDIVGGEITITVDATEGNALHLYGNPLWTYELPYDLVVTDVDGLQTALIAGYIILSRGVT